MGTEYYVVDKKNKTFYALGKGSWYIFNQEPEAFSDFEYLTQFIIDDIYDEPGEEVIEYINRIAKDLFEHFGKTPKEAIQIINDCTDDLWIIRCKGFRCVGTRYNEPGTKEYEDDMANCNRHLSDNPMNSRWYNPDDAKKYPEWEAW